MDSKIRFGFGKNWSRFLKTVNEDRIAIVKASLCDMLRVKTLENKTFLDIGCGSGLVSLAARSLGAKVHSFDFDPLCVGCATELKARYFKDDPNWTIEQGSVLDKQFLSRLGEFDIVYSWGVLHHTGDMWSAIANAAAMVRPKGNLFIAIYNDCGRSSKFWHWVKKTYCSSKIGNIVIGTIFIPLVTLRSVLYEMVSQRSLTAPFDYKKNRGMNIVTDVIDWVGGYPFEVATADRIADFIFDRSFVLTKMRTVGGGSGNNQFVFARN